MESQDGPEIDMLSGIITIVSQDYLDLSSSSIIH